MTLRMFIFLIDSEEQNELELQMSTENSKAIQKAILKQFKR
jgi:hypothetical protein